MHACRSTLEDPTIRNFIISGKLKPMVGGTFKLEEAAQAHEALEQRQTAGKVLLLPNS